MVLLTKARSDRRSVAHHGTQDIVVGAHVVVLEGRHFSAFSSGDEGVVISLDTEAQNCNVRFSGKSNPVLVALRHLRIVSAVGEKKRVDVPPAYAEQDSFGCVSDAREPRSPPQIIPVAVFQEPVVAYSDASPATGFVGGMAAISGPSIASDASTRVTDLSNGSPATGRWRHNGKIEPTVASAVNFNASGMFLDALGATHKSSSQSRGDQLQGSAAAACGSHPPTFGAASSASATAAASSPRPASAAPNTGFSEPIVPTIISVLATPQLPRSVFTPRESVSQRTDGNAPVPGHALAFPGAAPSTASCASTTPKLTASIVPNTPGGSSVHTAPVEDVSQSLLRGARLEVLEERLRSVEDEHRAEVASLRNALEECVRAIGTCARAIDFMCVDDSARPQILGYGQQPNSSRGLGADHLSDPEKCGDWKRVAAALHDAADLGSKVLHSHVNSSGMRSGRDRVVGVAVASPLPTAVQVEVVPATSNGNATSMRRAQSEGAGVRKVETVKAVQNTARGDMHALNALSSPRVPSAPQHPPNLWMEPMAGVPGHPGHGCACATAHPALNGVAHPPNPWPAYGADPLQHCFGGSMPLAPGNGLLGSMTGLPPAFSPPLGLQPPGSAANLFPCGSSSGSLTVPPGGGNWPVGTRQW